MSPFSCSAYHAWLLIKRKSPILSRCAYQDLLFFLSDECEIIVFPYSGRSEMLQALKQMLLILIETQLISWQADICFSACNLMNTNNTNNVVWMLRWSRFSDVCNDIANPFPAAVQHCTTFHKLGDAAWRHGRLCLESSCHRAPWWSFRST